MDCRRWDMIVRSQQLHHRHFGIEQEPGSAVAFVEAAAEVIELLTSAGLYELVETHEGRDVALGVSQEFHLAGDVLACKRFQIFVNKICRFGKFSEILPELRSS